MHLFSIWLQDRTNLNTDQENVIRFLPHLFHVEYKRLSARTHLQLALIFVNECTHTHSLAHVINLFGLLIAVDIRLRLCHSVCTIFLFAPIMTRTWDASADVSIAWSVHHHAHSPLSASLSLGLIVALCCAFWLFGSRLSSHALWGHIMPFNAA